MRKGFKVTLATVAIALLGFNAMAMAPTVSGIPDIIVGDAEDTSGANVFVYPDAFNLDNYVEDDSTDASNIIWSYSVSDLGNQRYTINGVPSQDESGSPDFVSPGSNRVDNTDDDPAAVDSDPRTVTIRDEIISPVAGSAPYTLPVPGGDGVIVGTEMVTFHASDGSTYSMEDSSQTIAIYSVDNVFDSYSPPTPGQNVLSRDFTAQAWGWTFTQDSGTVANSQGANGLCLEVALDGANDGNWASPYGEVELVANSVYEARLTVNTGVTNSGTQPLWMFVYDNAGGTGSDSYGGEMFYVDNEGGNNSAIDGVGRDDFRLYMAPASYQVPYFQDSTNGFFNSGLDAGNDMRLIFRIFDYANTGYGAELDAGQVCMSNLSVNRIDHDDLIMGTNVFSDSDLQNLPEWGIDAFNSTITFSGGNATIASDGNGWDSAEVALFRPGDTDVDFNNPGTLGDNWPIALTENTAYFIEYELSAPSQTAEENPPDVIRVGADVVSQELVTDHFLVPNVADLSAGFNTRGIVMPRTGGPYKYACIFYNHDNTGGSLPATFRPRFEILTSSNLNPLGRTTNAQGAVTVHSVNVTEINNLSN